MDFISTALVTLKEPTGMWESILKAFKGSLGSYILAVILIAVLVRIIFALVEIINKKVNMKNAEINNKMKPELDAIQKKYGHDTRVLQQKQGEIYKKYQMSMVSSCLPMLLSMILQFSVFLTLWNGLQDVANYNIVKKYEDVKSVYSNVIELNNNEWLANNYQEGDKLSVTLSEDEEGVKTLNLALINETEGRNVTISGVEYKENLTNSDIATLLETYVIEPQPEQTEGQVSSKEYTPKAYSDQLISIAEKMAEENYSASQEKFLWIKNVYRTESPSSPLFTKSEILSLMSNYYDKETKDQDKAFEETIFTTIIEENEEFDSIRSQKNGYYILTIIAVLTSFLSMWLSNFLMKNKNQPEQKSNKIMYIIMPLVFGVFTFMYTSLFAVYIIIGEIVKIAITPLTTFIVKKWIEAEAKKKKEKDVIEVDYRRRDI